LDWLRFGNSKTEFDRPQVRNQVSACAAKLRQAAEILIPGSSIPLARTPSHSARRDPACAADFATEARKSQSHAFNNIFYWAGIIGLAWAPFWLGSNRPIAWYINAAFFAVLLLLFEGVLLFRRRSHPISIRRVPFPAAAYVLVVIWIALQASTLTPAWLQNPLWQWQREGLSIEVPGSISINRAETYVALLLLLTQGAVFWLFLQLCSSPQRARWTVQAVAVIGVLYATYGIIAFYVFPGTVLWFTKEAYLESVTSSFINRNSYAYAGIGLVCALGAALSHYVREGERVGRSLTRRIAAFLSATAGVGGWWLAAAFVIGMALLLTGSRGGILASLAGVISFAPLVFMRVVQRP